MAADPTAGSDRTRAVEFVKAYGRTWQAWDLAGFVELFSDDATYVAHAMKETVVGRTALAAYIEKEAAEQGEVTVRMGTPVIDADRVAVEFWVTAGIGAEVGTIAGCLIARLGADGRCHDFREYWFEEAGHTEAFAGWGR